MKNHIINLFLLPALIAGLGLIPAGRVTAQTFTTLHSFTRVNDNFSGYYTNSDGANPTAGLILSGNTLYGTASQGGSSGSGTVFAVNTNGTGFTNRHNFTAIPTSYPYTNSDGRDPQAGLISSGNTMYGTAAGGGSSGQGTVFKVNTNGTGFTTLHSFTAIPDFPSPSTNSDGAAPDAGLILSGNILYGTAQFGGSSRNGTVFKVNTAGTGFTTLHSFTRDSDGGYPEGGLILSGNALYGTANIGGSSAGGTVFKVNTDGTGFTNLYSLGGNPTAGLILSGNTLYGTTPLGGSAGNGTVFAVHTDGTGFTNLYSFTATAYPYYTNSDGARPNGLILSGNTLYGTTSGGGSSGNGTVFAVNTNGTGFATLRSFTATAGPSPSTNSDGANPQGGLILTNNTLYGTAYAGGSSGYGTVFSLWLPPPPQLTIIRSAANVILRWPTNAAGFTLQSTTNLVSPAVWSTNSPGPVVVDGQNTVTNAPTGTQKFFRLSH